jgi:hypothetical protein
MLHWHHRTRATVRVAWVFGVSHKDPNSSVTLPLHESNEAGGGGLMTTSLSLLALPSCRFQAGIAHLTMYSDAISCSAVGLSAGSNANMALSSSSKARSSPPSTSHSHVSGVLPRPMSHMR